MQRRGITLNQKFCWIGDIRIQLLLFTFRVHLYTKNSPNKLRNFSKMSFKQTQAEKIESHSKINLNQDCPSQNQTFMMPLTLTQVYFNDQTCDLTSKKSSKASQEKDKQRCWTYQEHLKLCQIFNSRGLVWHEITRLFQKRQKAEIKQHLSITLKNIFQQFALFKRNDSSSETYKQNFRFYELKRMVKYISSDKHKNDEFSIKSRKVIGNLLAIQLTNSNKKCKYQVQGIHQLKQALLQFRKIIEQRHHLRELEHHLEKVVAVEHAEMEQGYQSDFQSAFSQNLPIHSNKQIINPNLEQNDQNESKSVQAANQNVIIQEGQDKIKAMLHRQGLLIYTNQSNQQIDEYAVPQVGSDCDILDNESYQQFYEQHELRGETGWRKVLCGISSQQQN